MKEQVKFSGTQLIQLKNTVVSNFDSSNWIELGAIVNMLDEVESHPRLLRSLRWNDTDYDGVALTVLRDMIGENNENLKPVQKYVATKCVIAGEDISSEQVEGRKIIFSPSIFNVPVEDVDSSLVSVMMPFSANFSPTYEAIKRASSEAGFSCKRVDDIWEHSTVIQDVFSLIFRSHIVVCDFSGKNPNVFYEAGIAHTLGKHVVLITQSKNDIPFDLQHHRYLEYLNNNEGMESLEEKLKSRFLTLA